MANVETIYLFRLSIWHTLSPVRADERVREMERVRGFCLASSCSFLLDLYCLCNDEAAPEGELIWERSRKMSDSLLRTHSLTYSNRRETRQKGETGTLLVRNALSFLWPEKDKVNRRDGTTIRFSRKLDEVRDIRGWSEGGRGKSRST